MILNIEIFHFKAIQHLPELPLQPFTAFVGNNGSGKSSVIECLRILQTSITNNIEEAFSAWGGLDQVRNYNAIQEFPDKTAFGVDRKHYPIIINIKCKINNKIFEYSASFNLTLNNDYYFVESEFLYCDDVCIFQTDAVDNNGNSYASLFKNKNEFYYPNSENEFGFRHKSNILLLSLEDGNPYELHPDFLVFKNYIINWQFLCLDAHLMGMPVIQNRLSKEIRLDYNGRNIAEYILWIRAQGQEYLNSIVQKMIFVLPYIKQIQPNIQETFNREVGLLLHETHDKSRPLPGWLLSSGTLRILALISLFDTPKPPSVLFVDEIENGLDPRTIGLLLNEIRNETTAGKMQVVITTHSPYLLDLLPIESIIVTDKRVDYCKYHIPATEERLKVWIEKFTPGRLFTTGKFSR